MELLFDLAYNYLVSKRGGESPVSAMRVKRGDTTPLELEFFRRGIAESTEVSGVIFVVKSAVGGETLALASIWSEAGETGVRTALLDTDTEEMAVWLGEASVKPAVGELTFVSGDSVISSRVIGVTVENDLWKGTEGTPLELPGPAEWLAERALLCSEQTLTDPQKSTAQRNIALSGEGDPNGLGVAASMTVVGDLSDGTNPITPPVLDPVDGLPGHWTATGQPNTGEGIEYLLYKIEDQDGYEFLVYDEGVFIAGWSTSSNAVTPDLTDGWLPLGPETGIPAFVSSGPALAAPAGSEYRQISGATGDLLAKWICRSPGLWEPVDINRGNAWDQVYALESGQQANLRTNARARHRTDRETILVRSVDCLVDPNTEEFYSRDIAFHRMPASYDPSIFAVSQAESDIATFLAPLVDHSFPWFFAYAYSSSFDSGWVEDWKPYHMLAVVNGAWMIADLRVGVAYRGHREFGTDQNFAANKNDPWDVTWNQQADIPGPLSWESLTGGTLEVLDVAPPGYPLMTAWPGGPVIAPLVLPDGAIVSSWTVRTSDGYLDVAHPDGGGLSVSMNHSSKIYFEFSGITSNRTFYIPDYSGKLRVSGDTIGVTATSTTLTLASGIADVLVLTLKASTSTAVTLPPAVSDMREFRMVVKQPVSTGNGAATFPGVKWPGGTAPTITTAAGKADLLRFISDGTVWYGSVIAQNYTP